MDPNPVKSMQEIRKRILWDNLIKLPFIALSYGIAAGGISVLGLVLIDGGLKPTGRKILAFLVFSVLFFGWGIIGGIKNYLMAKKLYGDKWKED